MEKQMKIIAPITKELLLDELKTKAILIKDVEKRAPDNTHKIYVFSAKDCPNLMSEVGRLREITFRNAGGGTGKAKDIDRFDVSDNINQCFNQLIIWDPKDNEIVGGYRYANIDMLIKGNIIDSPSGELFEFSDNFIRNYAHLTIELGRSFVQPRYQRGIYSLENLFEGLGTIAVRDPSVMYFFGKVTMYKNYHREARNMILYYLNKYCKDINNLVYPKKELVPEGLDDNIEDLKKIFVGNPSKRDLNYLKKAISFIKDEKIQIPPLFKHYHDLSDTMLYFGSAVNKEFGDVEETAILVKIQDIYPDKKDRYLLPYLKILKVKKWW